MFDLQGYGNLLIKGARLTIIVGIGALIIALLLGLIGSLFKLSKIKPLIIMAEIYTTVMRGVPELVSILLVYYGAPTMIQDIAASFGKNIHVNVNPMIAGILTLGFIYGAFATEVYRGAFLAVPRGQIEAARSCGMSGILTFRRIVLPQMWRFAIPGLSNVWMVLIKATALISVIQLPELLMNAGIASRSTHKPFSCYFAASLIYLLITVFSIFFQQWAEKRASRGIRKE